MRYVDTLNSCLILAWIWRAYFMTFADRFTFKCHFIRIILIKNKNSLFNEFYFWRITFIDITTSFVLIFLMLQYRTSNATLPYVDLQLRTTVIQLAGWHFIIYRRLTSLRTVFYRRLSCDGSLDMNYCVHRDRKITRMSKEK